MFMQKKLPRTILKWQYNYKEIHFLLFKKMWSFSTRSLTLLQWESMVTRVLTKPQYSFFNLISKSSNKAKKRLVNAYAVGCNFYAGLCRISLSLPVYYAGFVSNFADFQFWPYCPSLTCSNFCSSPSLPMEGISN